MVQNIFNQRHIGPNTEETKLMLNEIGVSSLDELINQTIPQSIRLEKDLDLPKGISEYEFLSLMKNLASKNKVFRSFIGMGYYDTIMPSVIQRNILENPSWYTSYTPYQAEISQGRLEALLNFQTVISELTQLPIANCSLLDEGTAAAEAMVLAFGSRSRQSVKDGNNMFFIDEKMFPQTIDVLKTRALNRNIDIFIGNPDTYIFTEKVFGAIIQYTDKFGKINDYSAFIEKAHQNNSVVAMAADLMSLLVLKSPGEMGVDIAFGSTQRFGIPMGFGGPHAAYFAVTETYKRNIPGRIIGISVDHQGNRALRMALQTREQHIKREKATSNICTAQALLATMAGMYAIYHGKSGLKSIAKDIHALAVILSSEIIKLGYQQLNDNFFDTLYVEIPKGVYINEIKKQTEKLNINLAYFDDKHVGISIDETKSIQDLKDLLLVLSSLVSKDIELSNSYNADDYIDKNIAPKFIRTSDYLNHKIFRSYQSETAMMRYIKKLENRDLSLNTSMIPLGSCTMKLNAASEMIPLSWPELGAIHPFAPKNQTLGYQAIIKELAESLCKITGFDDITFQPNSGASGEYAGLITIMSFHRANGQGHRNLCLIPSSAHGTNPASAVMAGMEVMVVNTKDDGEIDLLDLRTKAEENKDRLAALMITYPSTHGVFEESVIEVVKIIHDNGGQVYMDGANMNAQVGYTNPGHIGADVCHLNLHKTFAIPHGGGGPGVGPIATAKHLSKFLPGHVFSIEESSKSNTAVASAPYGSAMILPISFGYIKMLGGDGLKEATAYAILNANYIKAKLENHYQILFSGKNGRVAHELILDCNKYLKTANVPVIDIAKRLMDYGFHAPTVAFPVHGTLMVEPTESEPLAEIDRFIEAMISIRKEIADIENGMADKDNNVVVNAPHTMAMVTGEEWTMPYSRETAAFPSNHVKESKFWPFITKIDDGYGDRNLMCTCEL
ncbi:MAG: glycine dehydrogenase (aminomethyl-transferring) [Bacteroidetes bacterium CG2_30_33_31]|nr:MAG: glycine dehydrogenase (aminomethyl-transferring) [Bacteroidetes bacterium CG2_30_33_31]